MPLATGHVRLRTVLLILAIGTGLSITGEPARAEGRRLLVAAIPLVVVSVGSALVRRAV